MESQYSKEKINKFIDKLLNLHYSTPLTPEQEKIIKDVGVRYIESYYEELDRKWKLYEEYIKYHKNL